MTVRIVLAMLIAIAGAVPAWIVGRANLRTEVAELRAELANQKTTYTEAARLVSLAGARRLQEAQSRGDALTQQMAATEAANAQLAQEKKNALKTATTGRVCLAEPALRVLNGAPGLAVSGLDRLPAPASEPVAASGPAATDTDIGEWAITAGERFEACRARLQSLIDWHNNNTAAPSPTATTEPPEGRAP